MSDNNYISEPQYGEYKGKPTISIPCNPDFAESFPFTFGKAKAKAILKYLDEIKAFANDEDPTALPADKKENPITDDDDDDLPF